MRPCDHWKVSPYQGNKENLDTISLGCASCKGYIFTKFLKKENLKIVLKKKKIVLL